MLGNRWVVCGMLGVMLGLGCPAKDDGPRGTQADPVAARPQAADPGSEVDLGSLGAVGTLRARSFRFDTPPRPAGDAAVGEPSEDPGSPLSLTASDGTGLQLRALEGRGVLEPPLAFTELKMAFRNPEPRTIEGRFRITLPPGATVSRFAMKIGDKWQEGEVVERQAARRAYEDFLHRRQDPALLEQQAGNEFTARVFPIPANGEKELILSYSQKLASASDDYVVPLRGLPQVDRLDLRVLVARREGSARSNLGAASVAYERVEVVKEGWTPNEDLRVPQPAIEGRLGLRHENLVVARLKPIVGTEPEEVPSLLVLVDTSASRALGFHAQVDRVKQLVAGLAQGAGAETPVAVVAFDQDVELLHEGTAAGFDADAVRRLRERRALGASSLESALRWVGSHLENAEKKYARVLLVTDGVATAGATEGDDLRSAASALGRAGVERLDALVLGGLRDPELLGRLVTAGLPKDGVVIDGDRPLPEVARRLTESTRSGITVTVPGARWVWPSTLDGVQSGDEVLIFADLPEGSPFEVRTSGAALAAGAAELIPVERPLLERAWVKARIDRLLHQRDVEAAGDEDLRAAIKTQVTDLSVKHRVLSPWTALLVLETEADYERFDIDRKALADILTVDAEGITVLARSADSIPATPKPVDRFKSKGADAEKKSEMVRSRNGDDGLAVVGEGGPGAGGEAAPSDDAADESYREELHGLLGGLRGRSTGAMAQGMTEAAGAEAPSMIPPADAEPSPDPRMEADSLADEARPMPATTPPVSGARVELAEPERLRPRPRRVAPSEAPPPPPAKLPQTDPWTGDFAAVMKLARSGKGEAALEKALGWREESPGDVMALVALGEAYEALGQPKQAARAYGSLIDLFPSRADLRRYAGQRLERLAGGLELAEDTYRQALAQRPDHPASHHLHALALVRLERFEEAFDVLAAALKRSYPAGRFAGYQRILAEDLGLVAAAWAQAEPEKADAIGAKLRAAGGSPETGPSVRFVLMWETDANDVDFHIHDGRGGHAYYQAMRLLSGGELYADVTTGYGPECFTIHGKPSARAYPYRLQAHYYRRGPMGYGMGVLQVIEHDGKGTLRVEPRPFVVMRDGAYVDLGAVQGPLK